MSVCSILTDVGQCISDPLDQFEQAPNDANPHYLDVQGWLEAGEQLTNAVATVPEPLQQGDGITHPAIAWTTNLITLWLYGGRLGHRYAINVEYRTSLNRTRTKSFYLVVAY